jgi:glycosyltransferase involved in cell wall biosynthesis
MKILFDLLYIVEPEPAGVKIYCFELISSFARYVSDAQLAVIGLSDQEGYIRSQIKADIDYIAVGDDMRHWMHHAQNHNMGIKRWMATDQATCQRIQEYDVCISPFANGPLIDFSYCLRHVGVIHDLQGIKIEWATQKNMKSLKNIFRCWQKYRRMNALVSISKATKKAVDWFCLRSSHLIYNSVSHMNYDAVKPADFPADFDEYILDVNSFFRYKNATTLIQAFAQLKDEFPTLKLYFKGNRNPDYELLPPLVRDLGIEDRVCFDRAFRSNEEMAWLYRHARLFVSPSFMEGFGFTPVEAILNKIPTIVSDIETLREVTQGCATLFDPHSVEQLAASIRQHLTCPPVDEELQRRADSLRQCYSDQVQVEKFQQLLKS